MAKNQQQSGQSAQVAGAPGSVKKKKVSKLLLILLGISALFCLGAVIFAVFVVFRLNQSQISVPNVTDNSGGQAQTATLVMIKPGITITRSGKDTPLVNPEYTVQENDLIKTDSTGTGYLIFSDNSTVSLDVNSQLTVQAMRSKDDSFQVRLQQLAGRTWSRVEQLFGKKADYAINTDNTVAAVRGTQFGCEVTPGETFCYGIEHQVSLTLKNLPVSENNIALDPGKGFRNNESTAKLAFSPNGLQIGIFDYQLPNEPWKTFNLCLADAVTKLIPTPNASTLDLLKQKGSELGCGDALQPPAPQPPPPPPPTIQNVSLKPSNQNLICSWNATAASSYTVSLGKSKGATDAVKPLYTTKTNYTFSNLPSGVTYYCNVKASGDGGVSKTYYSSGIYLDYSTGTITSVSPGNSQLFYNSVSGSGNYYNITNINDLQIRYSIQSNASGQYLSPPNQWSTSVAWHTLPITNTGANSYSFNSGGVYYPNYGFKITYILENKVSGRILAQVTINTI